MEQDVTDPLLLTRECISYANLLTNPEFQHIRVTNIYGVSKVCENCFEALTKIDKYRKTNLGKKKPKTKPLDE